MKKVTLAIVLTLMLLTSTFSSARAITNGRPDQGDHPYVGLVVFDVLDEDGNQVPSHRCSASLLSPTVLLTAGHCTSIGYSFRIDSPDVLEWINSFLQTS
jgi:hypothetical protein